MTDYRPLATGGYANVSFNEELQIVKKTQPRYIDFENDKTILYSTVVDLAAHESLSCVPGVPTLQHYTTSNDAVDLIMPYYGRPLHEYLNTVPTSQREEFCVKIMLQIVATCIQLHENGLQHTDLKPSNIVINDKEDVTIIDLNILSNRVCDGNKVYWTDSIGTWTYAAPEIVIASSPRDTSIVWTLGLLMAVVAERFPISKSRFGEATDNMCSRTHWAEVYNFLKKTNDQHLPMIFCNPRRMSRSLEYICTRCLQWDPNDRPQLMELRSMLYIYQSSSLLPPPLHIHLVEWTCDPRTMDVIERRKSIWRLYDACTLSKKPSLFVRTVSWLDRLHLVQVPNVTLCALFMLAWLLQGEYVVDRIKTCTRLLDHFDVHYSLNQVMDEAWHVGEQLQWKLFEKTTDVYLFEYGRRDFMPDICNILIHRIEPYTMVSLATCI